MKRLLLSLALALSSSISVAQPVDHAALQQTVSLLAYIETLSGGGTNSILAGQYTENLTPTAATTNNGLANTNDFGIVFNVSGKLPALLGVDYSFSSLSDATLIAVSRTYKIIIQVGTHLDNPFTGGAYSDTTVGDFSDLITASTTENDRLNASLDEIAGHMLAFQNAGIAVLFRPLHEFIIDGAAWNWWQNLSTTEYKALWDYFRTYMHTTKGLHNILWVWAPALQIDTATVGGHYPGNTKVDIIGVDLYDVGQDPGTITGYGELATTYGDKPFYLSEWGYCVGGLFQSGCSSSDISDLAANLASDMPKAFAWLAWNNIYSMAWHSGVDALLDDATVVTADELPVISPAWAPFSQ